MNQRASESVTTTPQAADEEPRAPERGQEEPGATEQAQAAAETARQEGGEVVTTAEEQAVAVADEAGTQARNVVDDALEQVHDEARLQTHRAADSLHTAGGQMHALAEGRPEDAGQMDEYARQAANQVTRVADRVDELGFDGIVDEVGGFARRRPGTFLLGTTAAGFLVGRLGRNGGSSDRR